MCKRLTWISTDGFVSFNIHHSPIVLNIQNVTFFSTFLSSWGPLSTSQMLYPSRHSFWKDFIRERTVQNQEQEKQFLLSFSLAATVAFHLNLFGWVFPLRPLFIAGRRTGGLVILQELWSLSSCLLTLHCSFFLGGLKTQQEKIPEWCWLCQWISQGSPEHVRKRGVQMPLTGLW